MRECFVNIVTKIALVLDGHKYICESWLWNNFNDSRAKVTNYGRETTWTTPGTGTPRRGRRTAPTTQRGNMTKL